MSDVTKLDSKILKILEIMKLEVLKDSTGITNQNLQTLIIKCMRQVDLIKCTGSKKKEIVVNIILLLVQDYCNENLIIDVGDIENIIENLYNVGILKIKKCCNIL